jgi:hypothetical protein
MLSKAAVALVLAATVLAGCSGDAKKDSPETDFSDLPVQVTQTTGAIRCLVVDDRIVPVEGANVTARGAGVEASTKTDDQGRCVFSSLAAGTYFLEVASPLHRAAQSSVEVVAGVAEPPLTRIQVERLFKQDPYSIQVVRDGFFECSQAGAGLYSSSNCVYDPYRWALGSPSPTQQADNVTQQDREWHSDVPPGWQAMVFEMSWEPTSQGTSSKLGMIVSTYKPTRDGTHCFAELEGSSPARLQIDVGTAHETNCGVDPEEVPEEGMTNMSYFVSVRPPDDSTCAVLCAPPGLAVNQRFTIYLTQFVYGRPSDGWSFVAGDPLPF